MMLVVLLCCIKSKCSCCSFFWRIYWCRSSYKIFLFSSAVYSYAQYYVVFLVLVSVELMIFIFVWNISICNMHASPFSPLCVSVTSFCRTLISEHVNLCVRPYMCLRERVCVCYVFLVQWTYFSILYYLYYQQKTVIFLLVLCFLSLLLLFSFSSSPFLFFWNTYHFISAWVSISGELVIKRNYISPAKMVKCERVHDECESQICVGKCEWKWDSEM